MTDKDKTYMKARRDGHQYSPGILRYLSGQTQEPVQEEMDLHSALNMCGCGDPEAMLKYIHEALKLLNRYKKDEIQYDEYASLKEKLFSGPGAEYLLWNYLSNVGCLEHGSSLPGWITEKGEMVLAALNEYRYEEE